MQFIDIIVRTEKQQLEKCEKMSTPMHRVKEEKRKTYYKNVRAKFSEETLFFFRCSKCTEILKQKPFSCQ